MTMRNLILISVVILLSGCAEVSDFIVAPFVPAKAPEPYTLALWGDGSEQDLMRDQYECNQEARVIRSSTSGRGGNDIRSGSFSSSTSEKARCSIHSACLTSRGWSKEGSQEVFNKVSIQSSLYCIDD